MRNITLRKSLYCQLVATIFALIIVVSFSSNSHAEEIKPIIVDALDKGDTTLAVSLLNQEISIDPSFNKNYFMLGLIYYTQNDFSKAMEQFAIAFDKKSKDYESLYYIGMSQLALGEIDAAEKTFKKGIKKDKKEKHRFEDGLGLVLMEKEDYIEASKLFRKAIVGEKKAE